MSDLRFLSKLYIAGLATVALSLCGLLLATQRVTFTGRDALLAAVLAGCIALAYLFPLQLSFKTSLQFDSSVILVASLLLPSGVAMLLAGTGTFGGQVLRRRSWPEIGLNCAQAMLQAAAGGLLLGIGGWHYDHPRFDYLPHVALIVGVSPVIYLVGVLCVAQIIALETRESFPAVCWQILHSMARTAYLAPITELVIGVLAAVVTYHYPWMLGLIILPAAALQRILDQLNVQQQRIEERLLNTEAILAEAQRIANLGSWGWDLPSGHMVWSDESYRLFGYDPQAIVPTYDRYLQAVHPDDRARIDATINGAITAGERFDVEHRVLLPDGTQRNVRLAGEVEHEDGKPVRVLATVHNVTEQKRAEAALRSARDELEARVQERTADLRQAKEAAEVANRAKSEFLSRVSHELRTPLNAILGFAQLLARGKHDPLTADNVQQILRGGRHLLALIDEVLDIARIETDRLQLAIEPVSLRELIQECLDLIGPLAATRDLRLHANLCELQLPMVQADRQRLKQVLLNLLSNAVKYNHAGGLVRLATSINGNDQLRLEIQDTGIGILPNKLPRLFEPFDRLGAEQSDVEGTGLGLALTKRLVDAMGATIGVDSSPGHGSTFWLELPIVAHVLSDAKASDTDCGAGLLVPAAGRPAVVLYIEDNTANFRLVERMLELREGFTFIGAIQGGLGIELAREHQPDLICLDLNLPDLPGEEVLDRLKADPRTAHIPVIVISADAIPQRVEQLMLSGAVAYLTKPLELDQFLAAVDLIAAS